MANRRSSHHGDQQASKACNILVEGEPIVVAMSPDASMPEVEGCPRYAPPDGTRGSLEHRVSTVLSSPSRMLGRSYGEGDVLY